MLKIGATLYKLVGYPNNLEKIGKPRGLRA